MTVLVAFVLEVTVTVVRQTTVVGVPVILKLLLADVEGLDSVKKFVADPSGAAFTSIVTPCGGIVDVIETVSGKSVWGAGAWVEFAGGFNVTTRLASEVPPPPPPPPPPLLEQLKMLKIIAGTINNCNKIFFIKIILNEKLR